MARILIVVPSHGRPDSLARTLRAIARCARPADCSLAVVVAENGTAVAAGVAREFGAHYLHLPEANASRARNAGASYDRQADVLLFTDDDTVPSVAWVTQMTTPILAGEAQATVGAVSLVSSGELSHQVRAMLVESELAVDPDRPFLLGGNMAVSAKVFAEVGGFEESLGPGALGGHEDVFLGLRITATGGLIVALPNAVVEHHFQPQRLTRKGLLARARAEGRSEAWIMHHWLHTNVAWLRLRMVRSYLSLAVEHFRHAGEFGSDRERVLMVRVSRERQLLIERNTPPRYP